MDGENADDHTHLLDHTMDVLLCMEGYGSHYEKFAQSTNKNDGVAYWMNLVSGMKKTKVRAAAAAVADMDIRGPERVPNTIRKIIDIATGLAGRQ